MSGRFFHLDKPEASLSSRFGGYPALMLREPANTFPTVRPPTNSINPYMALPPITYRKFGPSTTSYDARSSHPSLSKSYPSSMTHHSILDHLLGSLSNDNGEYQMPERPIVITDEQESAIMLETSYQLGGAAFDPGSLKDLYLSLTGLDTDLTGCVSYPDLLLAFQRKSVPITEQLLRLIASLFISRNEIDKVNYEKILSFIGAAMKSHASVRIASKGQSSESGRHTNHQERRHNITKNVYYHDYRCPNNEESSETFTQKDDPVLLRLLENSIRHQFTPINLESLRISFQRADRLHRGSLSEQQIKELCYQHDIRIEDSILERIIHRCKQRGGGQYDWQQFIRYLERVQPVQTSLNITGSRAPNEYRMYIPHPSSSWPQAESPNPWGSPLHTHVSPIPPPIFRARNGATSDGETYLPPPLAPKSSHEVQTLYVPAEDDRATTGGMLYTSENSTALQNKLNQLQDEVEGLTARTKFDDPHNAQPSDIGSKINMMNHSSNEKENVSDQPWFDRFMQMSTELYNFDTNATGSIPESQMIHLVNSFNNQFDLQLHLGDIQNALLAARKSSGNIDINSFLKFLAMRNR